MYVSETQELRAKEITVDTESSVTTTTESDGEAIKGPQQRPDPIIPGLT